MKRVFLSFIISVFMFSNIIPIYADAQTENTNNNAEMLSVKQTDDTLVEEIENEVETTGYISRNTDIAIIDTNIETEDVSAESSINLDLENQDINISTEIEDETTGKVTTHNFNVVVTNVSGEDFTAIFTDSESGEKYEVNTQEVQASWYPLVVIAIHVARYGIKYAIKKYGKSAVTKATGKYGKKATAKTLKKLKFGKKGDIDLLADHWGRHKKEFPELKTQAKYLERAQALIGNTGKHVLVKKAKNGDIKKYNTKTNELVIVTKDDRIKTLFKPKYPDKTAGRKYFDREEGVLKK